MKRSFDNLNFNNSLKCLKNTVNKKSANKILLTFLLSTTTITSTSCIKEESFAKTLKQVKNKIISAEIKNDKTDNKENTFKKSNEKIELIEQKSDNNKANNISKTITSPADKQQKNADQTKELVFDKSIGVPVLMYHNIVADESKLKHDRYQITVKNLEKQLKYFKDNGYTTISLNELYEFMHNQKPIPKKSIVLTFDDGYYNCYKYLFGLLKKYEMHADIPVITGCMKEKGNANTYITWEQAKEMQNSGYVDIISHTVNHNYLTKLSDENLVSELENSEKSLKKYLGHESDILVIPYGSYNDKIINKSQNEYKMIISIYAGLNYFDGNVYKIKRFEIHNSHTGNDILNMINSYSRKK